MRLRRINPHLKHVFNIDLPKLKIWPEVLRLYRVQLELVHDDVQGPAVPEVHHQAPVKDGVGEVVGKGSQAKLCLHPLLWASAGKVETGVVWLELW